MALTPERPAAPGRPMGPGSQSTAWVVQPMKRPKKNDTGEKLEVVPLEPSKKKLRTTPKVVLPKDLILYIVQFLVGSISVNDLKFVLDRQEAANLRLVSKLFLGWVHELGFDPKAIRGSRPPKDFLDLEREEQFVDYFGAFDAMSTYVLEHFPPRVWAYLAVGRSATPLLGQLGRRCTGAKLINMPLGQISISLAQDQAEWLKNTKVRGYVFSHFDQFVTPEKLGGRTKVLVLDYGDYGKALYTVYHWLNAYYQSKQADIEVATYSISKEVPTALLEDPGDQLGEDVRPLPRKHVTIAGPGTTGIQALVDAMFGGELKALAIDLYDSYAVNELITKGSKTFVPKRENFYRLLRLLKEAEEGNKIL
jgi:hypothetical protein